jgi:hypothetical protein
MYFNEPACSTTLFIASSSSVELPLQPNNNLKYPPVLVNADLQVREEKGVVCFFKNGL